MAHYKSTLATTAAAVFGLVAAAHILHPGNYAVQPRPARTAVASAAAPAGPAAWVDPPARATTSATAGAVASAARAPDPDRADLLAPRLSAALPPGAAMAQALPSEMTAPADRAPKAEAARRAKTVRRAARVHQAAVARTAQADRPAVGRDAASRDAIAPAPQAAGRIDPIGDLFRGLGLGRDG